LRTDGHEVPGKTLMGRDKFIITRIKPLQTPEIKKSLQNLFHKRFYLRDYELGMSNQCFARNLMSICPQFDSREFDLGETENFGLILSTP
jgi:hypothetical protein